MAFPTGWLTGATNAVDRSIDKLVKDFKKNPFVHRREHSLHVDLYRVLIGQPELRGLYPIGETRHNTRLDHKEWPSTARASLRDSTPRRQS